MRNLVKSLLYMALTIYPWVSWFKDLCTILHKSSSYSQEKNLKVAVTQPDPDHYFT